MTFPLFFFTPPFSLKQTQFPENSPGYLLVEKIILKRESTDNYTEYSIEILETIKAHKNALPSEISYFMIASVMNQYDGDKRTPLSHAAEKGHVRVVLWLINEVPGINIEKGGEHHDEFWTPLHYAARYGHDDVIRELVSHGANIDALTSKKR